MPQSLARILVHVVFSTKNRTPYLKDEQTRRDLEAYFAGTLQQCNSPALLVGAVEDHVHILCALSKPLALSKLIEVVKSSSSKWLKPRGPGLTEFQWQNGYGAFSVSESHVAGVRDYIAGQDEHHRKLSFSGGIPSVAAGTRCGLR